MKYLFIDASESKMTYAQIGDDSSFQTRIFETDRDFASKITAICDEMLEVGGFTAHEADVFVVGTGPGSLTGIRVAASFFRTLAMVKSCELEGVNLFVWALKTLAQAGVTGQIKLVSPTLIDKAFEVEATLPALSFEPPKLVERSDIGKDGVKTYGINFSDGNVEKIELSGQALHDLIVNDKTNVERANDMAGIFKILPFYVIPSQAERNFKQNNKDR
ncbi:MAG: hypothetical protein PHQ02_05220 [Candidatus Riflebacteria bacterium]|nr:hypothetical protein [Candidatus Riflebacteria bacterium]